MIRISNGKQQSGCAGERLFLILSFEYFFADLFFFFVENKIIFTEIISHRILIILIGLHLRNSIIRANNVIQLNFQQCCFYFLHLIIICLQSIIFFPSKSTNIHIKCTIKFKISERVCPKKLFKIWSILVLMWAIPVVPQSIFDVTIAGCYHHYHHQHQHTEQCCDVSTKCHSAQPACHAEQKN